MSTMNCWMSIQLCKNELKYYNQKASIIYLGMHDSNIYDYFALNRQKDAKPRKNGAATTTLCAAGNDLPAALFDLCGNYVCYPCQECKPPARVQITNCRACINKPQTFTTWFSFVQDLLFALRQVDLHPVLNELLHLGGSFCSCEECA